MYLPTLAPEARIVHETDGDCDDCGHYSNALRLIRGCWLCPECRSRAYAEDHDAAKECLS